MEGPGRTGGTLVAPLPSLEAATSLLILAATSSVLLLACKNASRSPSSRPMATSDLVPRCGVLDLIWGPTEGLNEAAANAAAVAAAAQACPFSGCVSDGVHNGLDWELPKAETFFRILGMGSLSSLVEFRSGDLAKHSLMSLSIERETLDRQNSVSESVKKSCAALESPWLLRGRYGCSFEGKEEDLVICCSLGVDSPISF